MQSTEWLSPWLSLRRTRVRILLGLLALALAYTLGGYLLLPWLLQSQATAFARESLGRELRIAHIAIDPFRFTLRIEGIALADRDGAALLGATGIDAALDPAGLRERTWLVEALRVDGLVLNAERFADASWRLERLALELEAALARDGGAESEQPARFLIRELGIDGARIDLLDRVPRRPFALSLQPLRFTLNDLGNAEGASARYTLESGSDRGATLSAQGSLQLLPLRSEGSVALAGWPLDARTTYLDGALPLSRLEAVIGARFDYRASLPEAGDAELSLTALAVDVDRLVAQAFDPATEILAVRALRAEGGTLDLGAQRLQLKTLRIEEPRAALWLDAARELNLLALLPAEETAAAPAAGGWQWGIDTIAVQGLGLTLEDRALQPATAFAVEGGQLELAGLDSRGEQAATLRATLPLREAGTLGFEGNLLRAPATRLEGNLTLAEFPLPRLQPYIEPLARIRLAAGTLGLQAKLVASADSGVALRGSLAVAGLDLQSTIDDAPLASAEKLAIDLFRLDSATRELEISRLDLAKPWSRVEVDAERRLNLAQLLVPPAAPEDPASAPHITIGRIGVSRGSMDFADYSLPLPFRAHVTSLRGSVTTIDSSSREPARIDLQGQVGEFGLARIGGTLDAWDILRESDLKLRFRNYEMPELSPYVVQFAGQRIKSGKLDLNLNYEIRKGRVHGENDIVMHDVVLGEKVNTPGAVSLPLELAIALLQDEKGRIAMNIPVDGDFDNPQFSLGGVVRQAIGRALGKIVSAPFRALAGLFGGKREDFGEFEFEAGSAGILPPDREKIRHIADALAQRPRLALGIPRVSASAIDRPALQMEKLRLQLRERVGYDDPITSKSAMLDERIRGALETMMREQLPEESLDALKQASSAPPLDDPKGRPVLDQLVYSFKLRDRLLEAQAIGPAEIEALAAARANAVRDALLADGRVEAARVAIGEPRAVEPHEEEWVLMGLELTTARRD